MECKEHSFTALGGPCNIRLYGEDAAGLEEVIALAIDRLTAFEEKYSRYRADSVVSLINAAAGRGKEVTVDEETSALLDYAFVCHAQSDGLFDITSGVLRQVWDFKAGVLPEQRAIDRVLPLIGLEKVRWSAPHIELPMAGMEVDFGGFGKEHAADLLAGICRQQGIRHGLVDLAGDIAVIGPPPEGTAWPVGIRNPRDPATAVARVELRSGGLASSGDYERYMEIDGRRYSHILNPKTGWPVDTVAGITVISDSCLIAGTLTTIAMLKGSEDCKQWLAQLGVPHLIIDRQAQVSGTIQTDS